MGCNSDPAYHGWSFVSWVFVLECLYVLYVSFRYTSLISVVRFVYSTRVREASRRCRVAGGSGFEVDAGCPSSFFSSSRE